MTDLELQTRANSQYNKNAPAGVAAIVRVDGPESGGMDDNDEFAVWWVSFENSDGDEVGKVYMCRSWAAAKQLGRKIAQDRRLRLIDESTSA